MACSGGRQCDILLKFKVELAVFVNGFSCNGVGALIGPT